MQRAPNDYCTHDPQCGSPEFSKAGPRNWSPYSTENWPFLENARLPTMENCAGLGACASASQRSYEELALGGAPVYGHIPVPMLIPVTLRPGLTFYGLIALHDKEALRECRCEGRPYSPVAH